MTKLLQKQVWKQATQQFEKSKKKDKVQRSQQPFKQTKIGIEGWKNSCTAFSPTQSIYVQGQQMFANNPSKMQALEGAYEQRILWPLGSTIKIGFIGATESQKQQVKSIINNAYFNENDLKLNLFLDWDKNNNADVRISFQKGGSWSYLGTDAKGIPAPLPTMNFGWELNRDGVVVHEFGHMFGLIHEHQSPFQDTGGINFDTEAAYAYYAMSQNPPWTREQVDSNILNVVNKSSFNGSKYDPFSVMHYLFDCRCFAECKTQNPDVKCSCYTMDGCAQKCGFSNNSQQAIQLSVTDKQVLREMYPFNGNGETGDETKTDDDELKTDGNEPKTDGDEPKTDGNEPKTDGDATESKVDNKENNPVDCVKSSQRCLLFEIFMGIFIGLFVLMTVLFILAAAFKWFR